MNKLTQLGFEDNVESDITVDLTDLQIADDSTTVAARDISDQVECSVALEAIYNYLNHSHTNTATLAMANVAVESIYNKQNLDITPVMFSMEDFKVNPEKTIKVALENINENAKKLWMSIKEKIYSLAMYLGEKMNFFKRSYTTLNKRVFDLEHQLRNTTITEPRAKLLKPSSWYIDLMTSKGMPEGLAGVGKAVKDLVEDHREIAKTTVNKYTSWLLHNYKEANISAKAFSSLSIKTNEFVLPGSTRFNKSVNTRTLTKDNVYYRGKELPGGKAIYVEVFPADRNGVGSIGTMNDVKYFMADYDPQSFKLKRAQLAGILGMNTAAWLNATVVCLITAPALMGIPAAVTIGSGLWSMYEYNKAKVADTGHSVEITKDMIFKTLTLNQCKTIINDVKSGLVSLNRWYTDVFENNWKQKELDAVINEITSMDRVDPSTNTGYRALKRYCAALINLMESFTKNIHVYAFKTYNTMCDYVIKSLYQYKE